VKVGISPLQGFALGFEIIEVSFEVNHSVSFKQMVRIYLFLISINIVSN